MRDQFIADCFGRASDYSENRRFSCHFRVILDVVPARLSASLPTARQVWPRAPVQLVFRPDALLAPRRSEHWAD
jgi:hypothetical protein